MNTYTDYYNLVLNGLHRVVEFKCLASKYRELKTKLAFSISDGEKLDILKSESEVVTIHTPTFGGIYPNGKPA